MITEEKLNILLEELEAKGLKGRSSSKSHLKAALYDWRVERGWENDRAVVLSYEDKGYAFLSFTKREPRHCTLRHVFVLEDFRGEGIGVKLIDMMNAEMIERECNVLRFFADIPSVGFYEKLGYKWHGMSKTGLPFYYGDIQGNLIDLPKAQQRYSHSEITPENPIKTPSLPRSERVSKAKPSKTSAKTKGDAEKAAEKPDLTQTFIDV